MESSNENLIKEYRKEKLEKFLEKVKSKLEAGIEDIGRDNDAIIANWIQEIKTAQEDVMKVNVNTLLYSPVKDVEEEKTCNVNLNEQIQSICEEILSERTSISKKEELIANLTNQIFTEENILGLKINLDEMEEYLSQLLKTSPPSSSQNVEEKVERDKYTLIITTSISIASSIICKLKEIQTKKETSNFQKTFVKYCDEFTSCFPNLIRYNDFRMRNCLVYSIGNIIQNMLVHKMDKLVIQLISASFEDIFQNFEMIIIDTRAKCGSNNDKSSGETDRTQSSDIPLHTVLSINPTLTLDTSKSILQEILRFCLISKGEYSCIQDNLYFNLDRLIGYLDSNNKGILQIIYELLTFFFNVPFFIEDVLENIKNGDLSKIKVNFKEAILKKCANDLSHISPSLRFWIINLLIEFHRYYSLKEETFFILSILPKICLNRYLPVEGVKKNSLSFWKEIVGMGGIDIIRNNYEAYLSVYIDELSSMGQAEREAACRCVQEIIMKVYTEDLHKEISVKYSKALFNSILKCIKDPCWNVREAALNSFGYVYHNIKNEITEEADNLNIVDLMRLHLFDNIYEVRDAAAYAIRIYFSHISTSQIWTAKLSNFIISLIQNLNNTNELLTIYNSVKHEIFSFITIAQDFGFLREVDLWEFADGIIHLIKEINDDQNSIIILSNNLKAADSLMIVIDYLCKNYATLHNFCKKTIWEALTILFKKIHKSDIEFYFELIADFLLKEINDHSNSLAGFQAEKFVTEIASLTSKRFIKNKLKNGMKGNDNLTKTIESLINK